MRPPLARATLACAALIAASCATPAPHRADTAPRAPEAQPADEAPAERAPRPRPAPIDGAAFATFSQSGTLWTVVPGQAPRDTGLRLGPECAATSGVGSSAPLLSPDGRAVAYRDEELWVADLSDPAGAAAVTTLGPSNEVCVQLTAWSRDGRRLLFHLDTIGGYDVDPPMPQGVERGFYLWERGAGSARHLPWLRGAEGFASDDRGLIAIVRSGREADLVTLALADGAATALGGSAAAYPFSQLHASGELLAFCAGGAVLAGPAADPEAAEVIARGAHAEHQWPRVAPDLRHIAWHHAVGPINRQTLHLVVRPLGDAAAEPRPLVQTRGFAASFDWLDGERLVLSDADGLRLVYLDGRTTPLAGPGADLIARSWR